MVNHDPLAHLEDLLARLTGPHRECQTEAIAQLARISNERMAHRLSLENLDIQEDKVNEILRSLQ